MAELWAIIFFIIKLGVLPLSRPQTAERGLAFAPQKGLHLRGAFWLSRPQTAERGLAFAPQKGLHLRGAILCVDVAHNSAIHHTKPCNSFCDYGVLWADENPHIASRWLAKCFLVIAHPQTAERGLAFAPQKGLHLRGVLSWVDVARFCVVSHSVQTLKNGGLLRKPFSALCGQKERGQA